MDSGTRSYPAPHGRALDRSRSWQDGACRLTGSCCRGGSVGGPSGTGVDRREHVQAIARCVRSCARVHAPIIAEDPDRWRVLDSETSATIQDRRTGAVLESREAVPGSLHGPAPVLVIGDEPAQWAATKGDRLFSALRTSLGKVPNSRAAFIGTRPADGDHWFARLLQRSGTTYAADPDGDPFDETEWHRANPSLAYMAELLATYREEADDARDDPSLLPGFKALRLNLGGADVEVSVLIEAEAWQRCECDLLPAASGPSVWGVDLSGGAARWPPRLATGRPRAASKRSRRSRRSRPSTNAHGPMARTTSGCGRTAIC